MAMLTKAVAAACCLFGLLRAVGAQQSWGSFTKDDCSRCEYRYFYAKLNGIPSGASWEDYCPGDLGTPAQINGYNLVKPLTCVTGYLGIYGYFEVPDSSCSCYWDGGGGAQGADTFVNNGCQSSGFHQYSAHLQNIPSTPSGWSTTSWWIFACENKDAVVNGNDYFKSPSSCSVTTFSGMWGYFNVEDSACPNSDITGDTRRRHLLAEIQSSFDNEALRMSLLSMTGSMAGSRKLLQQKNYPFYPNDASEALAILAITHRGMQAVFALIHWFINTNQYINRFSLLTNGGDGDVVFQAGSNGIINMYMGTEPPIPGAGTAVTRPALIIPVLDAGDGPQGANAGTPYLGGHNGYQIPQATGNSRATAGYYNIALQDSTRTQPTVIATQVLTGCTIAILVENGQVYFAHIRPRATTPSDPRLAGQTTRNDLAYNMGQVGGFDGITVTDPRHYIVYGGNAINEGGYDTGSAHAIAFATTDDVYVVLWRSDQNGNYLGHRFISMREVSNLGGGSASSGQALQPRSVPDYPNPSPVPSSSPSGGGWVCSGLDVPSGCAAYLTCDNGKPANNCAAVPNTPDCVLGAAACLQYCTSCS